MARNKILVVDDEAAIRFGIRDFLEAHGYEVAEATNSAGASAVRRRAPRRGHRRLPLARRQRAGTNAAPETDRPIGSKPRPLDEILEPWSNCLTSPYLLPDKCTEFRSRHKNVWSQDTKDACVAVFHPLQTSIQRLLDDNQAILFALRDYFTVAGYPVDCACDQTEADCS